jgi:hypothetical protein
MGAVWAGFREVHLNRDSEIQKHVPELHKRAYDEHNSFLKGLLPGPAAKTAAVLSQECACSLQNKAGGSLYLSAHSIPARSEFMMIVSALLRLISALLRLISAGKNGNNVIISTKSSVVSKRAYESHKRAYVPQRLISAVKNGLNVFISGIGIRGSSPEVRNNRQPHVTSFQPHQSTRQQDSKLVRVKMCLRGKRKAQNHCLFSTSHF